MKRSILLLTILLPVYLFAQLNGAVILSGKIVGENHEGIAYASVTVKGSATGTTTDSTGKFSLITTQKFPFILVITSIGFNPQEIEVKNSNSRIAIQLSSQSFLANEVVVSASRVSEKILKSPVSIEKLDIRDRKSVV